MSSYCNYHYSTCYCCVFASSITFVNVIMALTSMNLATTLGQHNVAMPPPLILRDTMRSVVCLGIVPHQQPQSQTPFQAYSSYAMGPPEVRFLFSKFRLQSSFLCRCMLWCLLSESGSNVAAMFTNCSPAIEVCTATTLWSIPMAGMCVCWCWSVAHAKSVLSGCSLHHFEWGASCYSVSCCPSIQSI